MRNILLKIITALLLVLMPAVPVEAPGNDLQNDLSQNTQDEQTEDAVKYYDVPLSEDYQRYVINVCADYNLSPALVFAIMEQESQYNPDKIGDDGCSVGIMQIYADYHMERMQRLGCDDLLDPYQNALVGIDYLAEAFEQNPEGTYYALMYFNGGPEYATNRMEQENYSEYAIEVSKRAAELEAELEGGNQ